jgi:diguanylate cyclase (GGDEF)-like protein
MRQQGRPDASGGPSWRSPLFHEPLPLIGYVLGVLVAYLALAALEAMRTPVTSGDLTLFGSLMCCGAVCVEATRRLGQPSGVWRDLLSAWWLPVALLLPPLFALAAPAVLGLLGYLLVRRGAVYRRLFSSAVIGLSGACASALFRLLAPTAPKAQAIGWLRYPGPDKWLLQPGSMAIAVGCALAFCVLNACLVAIAAWLVAPDSRLSAMLWDRERMLLDLTETCVGILVTISCALSALLLIVALPPVILLQRSLLHSQLKAQARTDPKTGVLNAGAWQLEAIVAISRAQRRREPLAVLLADVDHFKLVNDTHGHLIGDAVLRTLAAEMRQQVRETDLVGRFGGEEFAIVLSGTPPGEAAQVAERIRRGAAVVKVITDDTIVGVTVSIGVAVLDSHGTSLASLTDLLAAADLALYRAKNTGRDRVCVYDPVNSPARTAPSSSLPGKPLPPLGESPRTLRYRLRRTRMLTGAGSAPLDGWMVVRHVALFKDAAGSVNRQPRCRCRPCDETLTDVPVDDGRERMTCDNR